MRVVAGTAKGRRLVAPRGLSVRPTTDRTREAVFNALGSLDVVDGARVLDLFAGTGALGIEALSRGAMHAVFVDRDRAARQAVEANLRVTGLHDQGRVVASDAEDFLRSTPERFDLVLLDPPYDHERWDVLLETLAAVLSPGAVVVIEAGRAVEVPDEWVIERQKRYGGTFIAIIRPSSSPLEPPEPR
jgi:16S rRNA (guanine966-N2)-methyltransferase